MKKTIRITILTIAALFIFAGVMNTSTIRAEAASKTTTSTSVRKTKKVIKLKKKAKTKTTKKVKTRKNTRKYTQNNESITKVTTVKTTTVTKFKEKKKTINTTIKTMIKTTATPKTTTSTSTGNKTNTTATNTTSTVSGQKLSIDDLSGTVDPMVIKAFKTMNYEIVIDGSVSYAGYFDGKNQRITLRSANKEYLLHETGHFISFITGFKDSTAEFKSIYSIEASKFTGSNKAYVTQNSAEYYAESFRDFYTRPATLKSARPATYAYIEKCIDSITDARINYINAIYYAQ